jgi:hypothetical protein
MKRFIAENLLGKLAIVELVVAQQQGGSKMTESNKN